MDRPGRRLQEQRSRRLRAGHITLAAGNGDPGDFFNMATALGQFKIEKIEVQRAP
jgi:hypothetical protein